jgi:adenylate cyclase
LRVGAYGYVVKPFSANEVLVGVLGALSHRRREISARDALREAGAETIRRLCAAVEARDTNTAAHIIGMSDYCYAIACELGLPAERCELLRAASPMHDVGKVGVPDHILMKPGRLTPEEMELMKRHAEFGRSIIGSSAQHIDGDNFLTIAGEIAATHHEKWDGSGYPNGLAGSGIPLSGRIMAAADIYDALISRRCYKEPYPHAVATRMMRELRGTTFDPLVLDAFFAIEGEIKAIAARYRDEAEGGALHDRVSALQAESAPPFAPDGRPATRRDPDLGRAFQPTN